MTPQNDQATLERQVRSRLMQVRTLEALGGDERLRRADTLRHEAEGLGKQLPSGVLDRLWQESLRGNIVPSADEGPLSRA